MKLHFVVSPFAKDFPSNFKSDGGSMDQSLLLPNESHSGQINIISVRQENSLLNAEYDCEILFTLKPKVEVEDFTCAGLRSKGPGKK